MHDGVIRMVTGCAVTHGSKASGGRGCIISSVGRVPNERSVNMCGLRKKDNAELLRRISGRRRKPKPVLWKCPDCGVKEIYENIYTGFDPDGAVGVIVCDCGHSMQYIGKTKTKGEKNES
jgi:hypothetical protein